MIRSFTLASAVLFAATAGAAAAGKAASKPAPEPEAVTETAPAEKGPSKSIVPAKYGTKYRNGGSDELAVFINGQIKDDKGEIDFAKLFELARKNGIDEAKVKHYEDLVAAKAQGSQGKARMTLRNMLATPTRKEGHLVGLDGKKVKITLPERVLGGAAAKAKEDAGAKADTEQAAG